MTGFKLQTSGVRRNRSTNWATVVAHWKIFLKMGKSKIVTFSKKMFMFYPSPKKMTKLVIKLTPYINARIKMSFWIISISITFVSLTIWCVNLVLTSIFGSQSAFFLNIAVIVYPISTGALWRNNCLTPTHQYWARSECH